ncbi:acyltransferase family protein [Photobacterium alginatilyticum]|uniref:acyltransferase family protein n=1 Tax=Photobacterium alginatilyticum TaxID=1775171 RepID=UPI00406954CC
MLSTIHALRGIASIMVFFAHYRTIDVLASSSNNFFSMGAYGVDIFFVISGFVVCLMIDNLKRKFPDNNFKARFLLSRFIRVIIPLWVAILLQYVVVGDYSGMDNLVKSIFLIPSQNSYYNDLVVYYLEPQWSLVFEVLFYSTLTLFISTSRTFLYSGLTLLCLCIPQLLGFEFYLSNPIILEFIFGIYSYKVFRDGALSESYIKSRYLIIAAVCFLLFSFLLKGQAGQIDSILRVLTVGVTCFFIITLASSNVDLNKKIANSYVLMFLGNISYSLYLTHMIGFRIFSIHFEGYGLITLFSLISAITVLFYILIDKTSHNLSKKILKR